MLTLVLTDHGLDECQGPRAAGATAAERAGPGTAVREDALPLPTGLHSRAARAAGHAGQEAALDAGAQGLCRVPAHADDAGRDQETAKQAGYCAALGSCACTRADGVAAHRSTSRHLRHFRRSKRRRLNWPADLPGLLMDDDEPEVSSSIMSGRGLSSLVERRRRGHSATNFTIVSPVPREDYTQVRAIRIYGAMKV